MAGYAFDDGPVKQWVPAEGQPLPAEFEDAILDPDVLKLAWNVAFEWAITAFVLGWTTPMDTWRDVMVMALYVSLPARLEKCGPVVRLPKHLLKTGGQRLISMFSTYKYWWTEKPIHWQEFKSYNKSDVLAERGIYGRLKKFDLPDIEWTSWFVDQTINWRGIPVNVPGCKNIIKIRDELISEQLAELRVITGLENPNSRDQLLGWLRGMGYPYHDLTAASVKRAILRFEEGNDARQENIDYERVLKLRQSVGRTSTAKYDAVVSHVDADGMLRNCLQFMAAARTHRWGGRVIQPQNLKTPLPGMDSLEWGDSPAGNPVLIGGDQLVTAFKLWEGTVKSVKVDFEDPMAAMASAIRPVIQAPPGWIFVIFDFIAVENVTVGWVSGDRLILAVFEEGRDPYLDFATYMYRQSYEDLYEEYHNGDKSKRKISKPAVLGCAYGLGKGFERWNDETAEYEATGLLGYARAMGVDLTPAQSELSVETWRGTYTGVMDLWADLETAAFRAVQTKKEQCLDKVSFDYREPFLRMNLPRGSSLHYCRPKLVNEMKPWGKKKLTLTYEGMNDRHQWVRLSTHPGKITENAVQKIARDILAESIEHAESRAVFDLPKLQTRVHVHDEGIFLVPEDQADEAFQLVKECMTAPSWAHDMPMSAAGYISRWFIKD